MSESSDLSNAFNGHFSTIGPKLANDIPLSNNNDHCHRDVKGINNRFEFRPTDSGIKNEKSKDYCKADLKQRVLLFITIFRLAIPAFFRFTDVTELM